jgi:hypothetical protein
MNNNLHTGNSGTAVTGNGRVKLVEQPSKLESLQIFRHRDPDGSPNARARSESMPPVLSEEMCRSMNREVTPDLRSHCTICGNPYQPGEGVLALACLSFAASAVPSSPASASCDPRSQMILGHNECVLPRLLTLLAGFQPEVRFVKASIDLAAGAFLPPELP